MLKIGVIGYGYWGPNIVRNFNSCLETKVVGICDIDSTILQNSSKLYPDLFRSQNYKDITESSSIDVVAIVTPVNTHYDIAKSALNNGKHIFIEKPFTSNSEQALELIEIAESNNLMIMVDHTFLFTDAVQKIKTIIDNNVLGNLYYYDSTRVNLGLFQHDINVIWDLAPHDYSIIDYIINKKPLAISAHGASHFGNDLEDVAYITIYFDDNLIGHINLNWLSPVKVRKTLIGGQNKMLVWNDLEADEKIKIYDKGVNVQNKEGIYKLLVEYRSGDMFAPRVEQKEALKEEIQYFITCLTTGKKPFNDGNSGLRIIQMLEYTDLSIKNKGGIIEIKR